MIKFNEHDDLWISVKAKSGKRGMKVHTLRDCSFLQTADNVREITKSEFEWHEPEECSQCKTKRLQ